MFNVHPEDDILSAESRRTQISDLSAVHPEDETLSAELCRGLVSGTYELQIKLFIYWLNYLIMHEPQYE